MFERLSLLLICFVCSSVNTNDIVESIVMMNMILIINLVVLDLILLVTILPDVIRMAAITNRLFVDIDILRKLLFIILILYVFYQSRKKDILHY